MALDLSDGFQYLPKVWSGMLHLSGVINIILILLLLRCHCFSAFMLPMVRQTGRASLSLSLRFNGHVPGGSGLATTKMSPFWIVLEEVLVTTGLIRCDF